MTSDHGEMLRWKIGHGADIYTEGLRKVPWVVLDDDQRREVVEEKKSKAMKQRLSTPTSS